MLNLDMKKIRFADQHNAGYNVKYRLHDSTVEKDVDLSKEGYFACYSNVFRDLKSKSGKMDRITTEFTAEATTVTLTMEEAIQWVEICKKHKMMPSYIVAKDCIRPTQSRSINAMFDCHLTLDIEDQYQDIIYLYLDTFRHLREDPGFVKAILYLHVDMCMNFYMAYILSSHLNIGGTGHHAVQVCKGVYSYNKPVPVKATDNLNLMAVRALYRFLYDPAVKRTYKMDSKTSGWNCNVFMKNLTCYDIPFPIPKLGLRTALKIVREFDNTKAKAMYDAYMKKIK